MLLYLRPHVYAAAVADDIVLLDVRADAYLCIRKGVANLRLGGDRRTLSPLDSTSVDDLLGTGLVCSTGSANHASPGPEVARLGLGSDRQERLRLVDAFRLCGSVWDYATRYCGRPLESILVFSIPSGAPTDNKDEVLRLARIFRHFAVWLPISGQCLVRSFVLLRFLQRSGFTAQWVFGVRTWPFGAHCWLQAGDVVLDDAPERLAMYEPILAVGT